MKLKRNEFYYTLGSVTATINGEKKHRYVYRFDGLKESMHKEYIYLPTNPHGWGVSLRTPAEGTVGDDGSSSGASPSPHTSLHSQHGSCRDLWRPVTYRRTFARLPAERSMSPTAIPSWRLMSRGAAGHSSTMAFSLTRDCSGDTSSVRWARPMVSF